VICGCPPTAATPKRGLCFFRDSHRASVQFEHTPTMRELRYRASVPLDQLVLLDKKFKKDDFLP
jgi:hypothetical protein